MLKIFELKVCNNLHFRNLLILIFIAYFVCKDLFLNHFYFFAVLLIGSHFLPDFRLITDDDYIEIEDENQIVRLTGAVDFDDVSTGIVVGLYGKRFGNDAFHVQQFIWPLPAVQPVAPTLDHDK